MDRDARVLLYTRRKARLEQLVGVESQSHSNERTNERWIREPRVSIAQRSISSFVIDYQRSTTAIFSVTNFYPGLYSEFPDRGFRCSATTTRHRFRVIEKSIRWPINRKRVAKSLRVFSNVTGSSLVITYGLFSGVFAAVSRVRFDYESRRSK